MSSRPPARRGMSLNAKIGVAVAALVALVFAVTMFSQLTRPADDTGGGGGGAAETPKSGLSVDVNFLRFDPAHPRAEYRDYPQFFEAGEHTVSFWASNPNEVPLTVSFGHTSCAQCSLAEFAVVSAPPLTGDTDPNPFAAVVGGVIGRPAIDPKEDPPFGLNALAHRARKAMEAAVPPGGWQRLVPANSARPDAGEVKPSVTVPAATSPDQPTWVVIRLNIKLSSTKTLETRFDCTRPDSPTPLPLPLATSLTLAEPCDVFPPVIDFKTLPEGVRSAEEVVYFWSATRTLPPSADPLLAPLPPPDVKAVRVAHLTLSPPVPATADEMAALAARLSPDPTKGPPARVTGAYKTILRLDRTAANASGKSVEADLGPFERTVPLTPDGRGFTLTKTPTVTVKATLLGSVRLAEGPNVKDNRIDLGAYSVRSGLERVIALVSDTPGLDLEVVPEQTEPRFLKPDPDLKAERKGDRTRWSLTLRIDKDVGGGELKAGSVVVLRIKDTGQLVRIPVVGRGSN